MLSYPAHPSKKFHHLSDKGSNSVRGRIDFFPSRCVFPESKKKTLPLFSAKIETKFGRSSTETKKSPTPKLFFAARYRWGGLELEIGLRLGLKGLSDFN